MIVVAIIGILAAMILIALTQARKKANDARIKGQISQIKSPAEEFFIDHTDKYYVNAGSNICVEPQVVQLLDSIKKIVGPAEAGNVVCYPNANAWAVSAPLITLPGKNYCLDSTGVIQQLDAKLPPGVVSCAASSSANNQAIVSSLLQFQQDAVNYYTGHSNSFEFMEMEEFYNQAQTNIADQSGNFVIASDPAAYAAWSQLVPDASQAFCIDSSGSARQVNNQAATLNGGTRVCPTG